jgi:hypothetical protein
MADWNEVRQKEQTVHGSSGCENRTRKRKNQWNPIVYVIMATTLFKKYGFCQQNNDTQNIQEVAITRMVDGGKIE